MPLMGHSRCRIAAHKKYHSSLTMPHPSEGVLDWAKNILFIDMHPVG